eukprot:15130602-Heterocapsa_arctica.AAC.1
MSEVCGGITAPSAPKDGMQNVSSALAPESRTCQGPSGLAGGAQEYRLEIASISARGSGHLQFSSPHARFTHARMPQPRSTVGKTARPRHTRFPHCR